MSTSTTPEPTPQNTGPIRIGPIVATAGPPPAETAPSAILVEGPTFARFVGFAGLFFLVLGSVVVVSTRALGPRWVSEGFGFLSGALGLSLMLYHAVTDGEQEIRRMYGGFAAFWLVFAIVAALVPGPFEGGGTKTVGHFLLPWGVGAGFICLLFTVPFSRHETDATYRSITQKVLLAVGGLLAVGSVAAGIFQPDFLAGKGLALALLGLGFICAYLGQVDTSDGIGFTVAFALGAFGAVVVAYAIGRAAFPTLLFEGPAVLRKPNGSLDWWKALFRMLAGVAFLVPVLFAWLGRSPLWLRTALLLFGLAGAGVVVASALNNPVLSAPRPFLVPTGLMLMGLGLAYTAVSVGICSDNQFVTLTRRELSSYFLSPIGYLVLAGMLLIQWLGYQDFVGTLASGVDGKQMTREPIVRYYFVALLPVLATLLLPPALTMRLLAEEKRTGSLEVLLTAPVNEWPVVISKFVATWLFFLITWLPSGLFLLALRMEVGQPFDYRPLLSFYVCLACQGLAFVGMGLFFSTLTKNQIVAAVLTFVGMIVFLACYMIRTEQISLGLPPFVKTALGRLSYIHMWMEALAGRLPLRDCLLFASIGAFWMFLSVKVLETRKWS